MIKLVTFLKRDPSLTRPGFEQRWLEVHAPLAAVFPGLRGYMLGFSLDAGEPLADGVAQLWFDSREAVQASYASEIGRRGSADASAYLARREHLLASERWIAGDGPIADTPFKLLLGIKRAEGLSRQAFCDAVADAAETVRTACGARQLRLSLDDAGLLLNSKVAGTLDLLAGEAVFDALIEMWFATRAEADAARGRLRATAGAHFASLASVMEDALLGEHVVVPPPPPACGLTTGKQ